MTGPHLNSRINPEEIAARGGIARHMAAGFSAESAPESDVLCPIYARNDNAHRLVAELTAARPALADIWQQLDQALEDVPALGSITARLSAELAEIRRDLADARLDRANLLAAMRATLAAHADGENDSLSYLRDQISALAERREPVPGTRLYLAVPGIPDTDTRGRP
jgi:hypothetical protein